MNRIRELRQQLGWRQVDLAERLHLKKNTVSRYETGSLGLDSALICDLCDLFHCTADYLLCRSDSPGPLLPPEDQQLLRVYHDLPLEIRRAVDGLMAPYSVSPEKKKVV